MNKSFVPFCLLAVFLVGCAQSGPVTFDSPILPPEPGDVTIFYNLLMQLISGGLAAAIVYKFLGSEIGSDVLLWLAPSLGRIGLESEEVTRYIAILLSGGISFAAYLVAMAFQFVAVPTSTAAWINLALALLGVSFTGSQVIHARCTDWVAKRAVRNRG